MILLAAAGQLALERARVHGVRPPLLAAVALAGSAILAVLALRESDALPVPPRPFELPRFPRALYLACLPGTASLVLALLVYLAAPQRPALSARLWLLGIALLLIPGVVDWRRNAVRRSRDAKSESRRLAAAAALLFIIAFGVRIWAGIDRIPGWLDGDEAATGLVGRKVFAEGFGALFGFWEMGNPNMTLFVSQLAAWPFGGDLLGLRLGSALLGSLSVVLLFDFGRRLVGASTAFVAGLLLSVNHAFLHYSRAGQIYVDTPFFASLLLALLLRALTGGSFLALTGAGVVLGIGAATYVATQILPAAIAATLAGWAIILRWPSRRALQMLGAVAAIALLVCAPMFATILRMPLEIAYQRIPTISLLRADGFRQLRDAYGGGSVPEALARHLGRTISIFNSGYDYFKAYGATRALNDAVTAALIPAAAALVVSRASSLLGWVSLMFTGVYVTAGVLLSPSPPTYHRILVVLLFSSLGVAWTLTGLARTLAAGLRVRQWLPAALACAVVAASAWLNL
ncbi:MAG TPA: glycosyltransferase family 39 protein, partial [Thermoanaerobaculia bacterium]|nr:glycosyltransferase family 39 protein [Thermoanaerobaculia bacterium]